MISYLSNKPNIHFKSSFIQSIVSSKEEKKQNTNTFPNFYLLNVLNKSTQRVYCLDMVEYEQREQIRSHWLDVRRFSWHKQFPRWFERYYMAFEGEIQ